MPRLNKLERKNKRRSERRLCNPYTGCCKSSYIYFRHNEEVTKSLILAVLEIFAEFNPDYYMTYVLTKDDEKCVVVNTESRDASRILRKFMLYQMRDKIFSKGLKEPKFFWGYYDYTSLPDDTVEKRF